MAMAAVAETAVAKGAVAETAVAETAKVIMNSPMVIVMGPVMMMMVVKRQIAIPGASVITAVAKAAAMNNVRHHRCRIRQSDA